MIRRQPPPQRRQREADEFASFEVERPRAVMATGMDKPRTKLALPKQKIEQRKRQSIRDAAQGEECQMRLVGCCVGGTETTVLAHWPGLDGDRGMGLKAFDLCSAFACVACHDVLDQRRPLPVGASRQTVLLDFLSAHMRTLVRLAEKGLL